MNEFCRKLLTEWRKLSLPFRDKTIVVAVSGGADSTALAAALHELKQINKLNLRFVLAHFNHNLRGEFSDTDANFVKQLAANFGFELILKKGKVSTKGNLEQNARLKRYEFLGNAAKSLNAYGILTAHTLNDQAETFLMNLIRGSGLDGLSSMRPVRIFDLNERTAKTNHSNFDDSKTLLIRPLLRWAKREDTENFCNRSRNTFCKDAMNEDLRFQRVRIRKVLLPLLKDFNPKIIENLAKTAELLRLEIESRSAEADFQFSEQLNIQELKKMPKFLLYRTLRAWLGNHRGNLRRLDLKHIEAIERLIHSSKSGRIAELKGDETVYKSGGKLYFGKLKVEK